MMTTATKPHKITMPDNGNGKAKTKAKFYRNYVNNAKQLG